MPRRTDIRTTSRSSAAPAPERRVAPRMGMLAGAGLLAAIAFGAFACIVTLVAGLALLALDAERHAQVASARMRREAQRHGGRLASGMRASAERRATTSRDRAATPPTHTRLPRTTP
jgi:hypothetical protein